MKILSLNNFHYRKGGSETVYFDTAALLQKKGHEVIFFQVIMLKIYLVSKANILLPISMLFLVGKACRIIFIIEKQKINSRN